MKPSVGAAHGDLQFSIHQSDTLPSPPSVSRTSATAARSPCRDEVGPQGGWCPLGAKSRGGAAFHRPVGLECQPSPEAGKSLRATRPAARRMSEQSSASNWQSEAFSTGCQSICFHQQGSKAGLGDRRQGDQDLSLHIGDLADHSWSCSCHFRSQLRVVCVGFLEALSDDASITLGPDRKATPPAGKMTSQTPEECDKLPGQVPACDEWNLDRLEAVSVTTDPPLP